MLCFTDGSKTKFVCLCTEMCLFAGVPLLVKRLLTDLKVLVLQCLGGSMAAWLIFIKVVSNPLLKGMGRVSETDSNWIHTNCSGLRLLLVKHSF